MVTPCPLCHLSLDAWQSKLKAATGKDFQMPILHLSQLIGVAAGLEASELKFKRHVVSVKPMVEKLQVLDRGSHRRGSGRSGLGVVRGRVGAVPHPRSAARAPARGARRASHRAPLRLSPRPALARSRRGRAGRRVDCAARARSRLPERRSALARRRRRPAAPADGSASSALLRDSRQPRLRHLPRSVLGGDGRARGRAGDPALGRGRDDRAARPARLRRRARTRAPAGLGDGNALPSSPSRPARPI